MCWTEVVTLIGVCVAAIGYVYKYQTDLSSCSVTTGSSGSIDS